MIRAFFRGKGHHCPKVMGCLRTRKHQEKNQACGHYVLSLTAALYSQILDTTQKRTQLEYASEMKRAQRLKTGLFHCSSFLLPSL